jgi:hypothetical protein
VIDNDSSIYMFDESRSHFRSKRLRKRWHTAVSINMPCALNCDEHIKTTSSTSSSSLVSRPQTPYVSIFRIFRPSLHKCLTQCFWSVPFHVLSPISCPHIRTCYFIFFSRFPLIVLILFLYFVTPRIPLYSAANILKIQISPCFR